MSQPIHEVMDSSEWPLVYFPHEGEYPKRDHDWSSSSTNVLIYCSAEDDNWRWRAGYCDLVMRKWYVIDTMYIEDLRVYCWMPYPPKLNTEEHELFDFLKDF